MTPEHELHTPRDTSDLSVKLAHMSQLEQLEEIGVHTDSLITKIDPTKGHVIADLIHKERVSEEPKPR